jgi:hypothetical protein
MASDGWARVELWNINYQSISGIIGSAKSLGLIIDRDFSVTVVPAWTNRDLHGREEKSMIVAFRDPSWATWFQLKQLRSDVH